ncbi:hypothetical protein TRFO_25941 [Tritrichomonas foetus]|uniref:F5/8 type C domain-containing protein n=1 Tax=Tritrichomonas foetus TaxID=1144522 RepID=A0A1J4K8V6_9EUKA|nr:hypothetical protein TRFO_25941 [Tritrichomonas foetus]|eukprot:OHT06148.1 hypothetical protein TRFO_25941 [Tritrichomonas foetus]
MNDLFSYSNHSDLPGYYLTNESACHFVVLGMKQGRKRSFINEVYIDINIDLDHIVYHIKLTYITNSPFTFYFDMIQRCFSFNPRLMNNINLNNYISDFTFIINKKEKYQIPRFVADILSPNIASLHTIDSTINEYSFDISSKGNFQDIIDIVSNKTINLKNDETFGFFLEVMKKLGNENIYEMKKAKILNIKNVFDLIKIKTSFGLNQPSNLNNELDFVASNLYQINDKQLKNLDYKLFYYILTNPKLCIKSESWLLNFIIDVISKNPELSYLFEFVEFSMLEKEDLEIFIQQFDVSNMTQGIWKSVSRRLTKKIISENDDSFMNLYSNPNLECENRYPFKKRSFNCDQKSRDNQKMDGIIRYLTETTRGNICDNETINIFASSPIYNTLSITVDLDSNEHFNTISAVNSWVTYDFKGKIVTLKSYSIKTVNYPSGNIHMRNWVLEGSTNGKVWETLDARNEDFSLNQQAAIRTFSVEKETPVKFIRIKNTGENWSGDYHLAYSSIEFYGDLTIL